VVTEQEDILEAFELHMEGVFNLHAREGQREGGGMEGEEVREAQVGDGAEGELEKEGSSADEGGAGMTRAACRRRIIECIRAYREALGEEEVQAAMAGLDVSDMLGKENRIMMKAVQLKLAPVVTRVVGKTQVAYLRSARDATRLFEIIGTFEVASGQKLNPSKSTGVPWQVQAPKDADRIISEVQKQMDAALRRRLEAMWASLAISRPQHARVGGGGGKVERGGSADVGGPERGQVMMRFGAGRLDAALDERGGGRDVAGEEVIFVDSRGRREAAGRNGDARRV